MPKESIENCILRTINDSIYKVILSAPSAKGDDAYRKIVINLKEQDYLVEKYTQKQVFHESLTLHEVRLFLIENLTNEFRQCNAWDEAQEHMIKISKKGKVFYKATPLHSAPKKNLSHNRGKSYILSEGSIIPPLVDMGIFTADGKIVKSMYDKYKQINRFIELIDDEIKKWDTNETLHIIDFGCGKSYLTFILYYYLTELKKIKVKMIGLDLKAEVIDHCNVAAKKYNYKNLEFKLGDINGYKANHPVDMVVTLHACNTATDYALYNAIEWGAKIIFSVPCCQHELNEQIKSDKFNLMMRYGIIKERTAALMTDAIRANLLEYMGYKTQLLEFVDLAHTPKNILIRATKRSQKVDKSKELIEIENILTTFEVSPTLYNLLKKDNKL